MLRFLIFLLLLKESVTEFCVCVPFWECGEDYSTEDLSELLDLRDKAFECPGVFDTCCKVPCGQRKTDSISVHNDDVMRKRILGDNNEANFAEFPWMLAVLYKNKYRCGASLIHPKVALTAAHCVQNPRIYTIRAGEYNWDNKKEPLLHQDRITEKIIIHPKYDPNWLHNDISLLILNKPFQLSEHIGIMCLPNQNSDVKTSDDCIATGWGKNSYLTKSYQSILKKVNLPIVEINKCVRFLQEAQLGSYFSLHESFICAGGKNKDTCQGDGGSPLICLIDGKSDKYEQVGIVSWGLNCGRWDTPGVYVNVALFIDWIDNQMKKHNLDYHIYKYR